MLSFNYGGFGKGLIGQQRLGLCTLEERRHQLDMTQTFTILNGVENMNKSTWFTPASDGQVRVTRMAADPLNVRHQPFRKPFYSQRVVEGWNEVPTNKNSVTVNSFKMASKKKEKNWRQQHRGQDWRKDEVDVLLESTIVPVGPTRLNLQVSKKCCGSGMFIPDPNFSIPDPGYEFFKLSEL